MFIFDKFNKTTTGKILFPLLLALVSLVCHISRDSAHGAFMLDRVVAMVNNDVITWSELRKNIETENAELLKALPPEEREKKIKGIERPFLESMIEIKLQVQEAKKLGYSASAPEVDAAVAEIKNKYKLSDEKFLESLESEGFTPEAYRARLSEQMLIAKAVRQEISDRILISENEIKEYFHANGDKYKSGKRVRIRQILFMAEDDPMRIEAETKAEYVMRKIEDGEDFGNLAAEFSEDISGQFGGDLGYISSGSVLKEIEEVAFALKAGEVSKPFWSPKGLHIIKVEDIIERSRLEEVREEIKKILFNEAFNKRYEEWIETLREKSYIEVKLASE